METLCDPAHADQQGTLFRAVTEYSNLAGYILRFSMGFLVTVYLFLTRKRRSFPRFVKLQLLLIDVEYALAIGI